MKVNKILLIIQTALMYVSLILLIIPAFALLSYAGDNNIVYMALFTAGVVVGLVAALIAAGVIVPSIVSIFTNNNEDMSKFTMIIKLASIPWYVGNFAMWGLLVAGMLNPFLLIAIPLVICIAVFITYVDMLSISMNNICVIISNLRKKKYQPNALLIVGMVFQFIFCLDILGAIFTYLDCNKQEGYLCNL